MVFTCFRDGKCEWQRILCNFTDHFNYTFNKNYRLIKCLDISGKTGRPQPEVLLEFDEDPSLVIECKKIVYPENYYENHRKFHAFGERFFQEFNSRLISLLPQENYRLETGTQIYKYTISQVEDIASNIADSIVNKIGGTRLNSFSSSELEDIQWSLYPNYDSDCESNIVVNIMWSPSFFGRDEASKAVIKRLGDYFNSTEQKFIGYENCIKILVLELCGDFLLIPGPEELTELCNQVSIPDCIDQIWIARSIGDDEKTEIAYHKIH